MMLNKRGSSGEMAIMIYRILFVTISAFIILGASSIVYNYNVKTENTEAMLLGRAILDCISRNDALDIESLDEISEDLFSYCDISANEEYAFVKITIYDSGELIKKIYYGDDGLEWVRKVYDGEVSTSNIEKYKPGYYRTGRFPINAYEEGVYNKINIDMEVVVNGK